MTKQGRHSAVWMHSGYCCAKCGAPIPAGRAMLTWPGECGGGIYFDLVQAGLDSATATRVCAAAWTRAA
jgi:hypothetical protein